jgi:hypothetical protein
MTLNALFACWEEARAAGLAQADDSPLRQAIRDDLRATAGARIAAAVGNPQFLNPFALPR